MSLNFKSYLLWNSGRCYLTEIWSGKVCFKRYLSFVYILQCIKLVAKLLIWKSRLNTNTVLLVHTPTGMLHEERNPATVWFCGWLVCLFKDGKTEKKKKKNLENLTWIFSFHLFPSEHVETWWSFLNTAIFCYSACLSLCTVRTALNYINPKPAFHLLKSGRILGVSSLYPLTVAIKHILCDVCSTWVTVLLQNRSTCFHWLR